MDGHVGETRFPGEGCHFGRLVGPAFQQKAGCKVKGERDQAADEIESVRSAFQCETRIVTDLRLGGLNFGRGEIRKVGGDQDGCFRDAL